MTSSIAGEVRAVLHQVITELPPAYRSVVALGDLEQLSTEETAQILDLTTDTVKTRLHRARAAMRQKLDCHLGSRCIDVQPIATPSRPANVAETNCMRPGGRPVISRFRAATLKPKVADMPIAVAETPVVLRRKKLLRRNKRDRLAARFNWRFSRSIVWTGIQF